MNSDQLQSRYNHFNALHFEGILPPCRIIWSRQLTRAAGNIHVQTPLIKLSQPLLIAAFADGKGHEVSGVWCLNSDAAIDEVLKHEMIHLWLFVRGLPHGHTPEFRAKARAIGQSRTRHAIARPMPKSGWIYRCANCQAEVVRRRRWGRARACAVCCRRFNGGKFDARFKLRGTRLGSGN